MAQMRGSKYNRDYFSKDRKNFNTLQRKAILISINENKNEVKGKLLRTIAIGTHIEQGADTFWQIVTKNFSILFNPVVCLKFCFTLHKILRDGHFNVIPDSLEYLDKLRYLGIVWLNYEVKFSTIINFYCNLLAFKLDFHIKNPTVSKDFELANDGPETTRYGKSLELLENLLDYLYRNLNLQDAMFKSLPQSISRFEHKPKEYRLAPILICFKESTQIYNCCIKHLRILMIRYPNGDYGEYVCRLRRKHDMINEFTYLSKKLKYLRKYVKNSKFDLDVPLPFQ